MTINYEDFAKLELKAGKILSAAKLEGSDKLLKLEVDIGEKRELVAGIARDYSAEELVGKTVVVLANLEPKQLKGVLSNGMVLAASGENGGAVLLTTDKPVAAGAKIL